MNSISSRVILTIFFLVLAGTAHSENLHSWTDEQGRVHYSNKANSQSTPAALRPIQRENLSDKIRSIRGETPENCFAHGGVDCRQGADIDGSVVCLNGFRDARLPFRVHCSEATLEAKPYVLVKGTNEAGEPLPLSEFRKNTNLTPIGLMLSIRNTSDVQARGLEVQFFLPWQVPPPALGHTNLEAFESADFTLSFAVLTKAVTARDLTNLRYKVSCENCSAVKGANH